MLLLLALLVVATCGGQGLATSPPYTVPEPLIQAFSPAGLQVSVPDSDGVELFAFHGSVNKPLKGLEAGDMSHDVVTRSRGRWVFDEPQIQLLPGDILYYWLYVQKNGRGYRKDSSYWIVDALQSIPVQPSPPPPPSHESAHSAASLTPQDIIASMLRNNCSSQISGLNRDPLLYLLEGYEFVLVVKNGQLQLKDRPSPGATVAVKKKR